MTFYAAQITDQYLLMANDKEVFEDAAKELATSQQSGLGGILGWNAFSTHSCWVCRSFGRATSVPRLGTAAVDMQELAFYADLDKELSYVQTYIAETTTNNVQSGLPASKLVVYQQVAPGAWQGSVPLKQEQTAIDTLYQIMGYFGFAAVL